MSVGKARAIAVELVLWLLLAASPGIAAGASTQNHHPAAHSLLTSRNLWATVDVCSPTDQPNTVGIRGSMPSDMHPKDEMFMRFQLQYLNVTTKEWVDVGPSADSGFFKVGNASTVRQAGRTFELVPPSGTYTLRGYLEFQWRRGAHVAHSVSRLTAAGHTSLAGADPPNYSAASCELK